MPVCIIEGNVKFHLETGKNKEVIFAPIQIHGTLSSILRLQVKNPGMFMVCKHPYSLFILTTIFQMQISEVILFMLEGQSGLCLLHAIELALSPGDPMNE